MKVFGELNLAISKKANQALDDFIEKFSDMNIRGATLQLTLMDGTIHNVEVEDHFINWDTDEE